MPTWQQIQTQLRHPNNPVVFIDVTVGTMVSFRGKPEIHRVTNFEYNKLFRKSDG